MRVNARLNSNIKLYTFLYSKKNKRSNSDIIFKSGFIGSGKGPDRLSSNYKTELIKSLKKKWS